MAIASLGLTAADVVQIGLAAASIAASLLLSSKGAGGGTTQGPKLDTLDVMTSAYAQPVAYARGTMKAGGNIIWADKIKQKKRKAGTGGNYVVYYYYYGNFAMAVGDARPGAKLMRVWADTKLIYDRAGETTNKYKAATIRFHAGGPDELPDPLIEANVGAANCPAFRHLAYIVFDTLPLADFGNRIPQITAEINWEDSETQFEYITTSEPVPITSMNYARGADVLWDRQTDSVVVISQSPCVTTRIRRRTMDVTAVRDSDTPIDQIGGSDPDPAVYPSSITLLGRPVTLPFSGGDFYLYYRQGLYNYVKRVDGYSLRTKSFFKVKNDYPSSMGERPYTYPGFATAIALDTVMEGVANDVGPLPYLIGVAAIGTMSTWALIGSEGFMSTFLRDSFGRADLDFTYGIFPAAQAIVDMLAIVYAGYAGSFGMVPLPAYSTAGVFLTIPSSGSYYGWPGYAVSASSSASGGTTPQIHDMVADKNGTCWALGSSLDTGYSYPSSDQGGPVLVRLERNGQQWTPTGLYLLREANGGIPGVGLHGVGYAAASTIMYDPETHSLVVIVYNNPVTGGSANGKGQFVIARLGVQKLAELPSIYPRNFSDDADSIVPNIVADAVQAVRQNETYSGDHEDYNYDLLLNDSNATQFRVGPDFGAFVTVGRANFPAASKFYLWRLFDLTVIAEYDVQDWLGPNAYVNAYGTANAFYSGRDHSVFIRCYGTFGHSDIDGWYQLKLDRTTNTAVSLGDVVRDAATRAGIPEERIDTSELDDDTIYGVIYQAGTTARQAIEPFSSAFSFYSVEEDFQIKFRKKNRPAVVTISEDELGAQTVTGGGPGKPTTRLSETRTQEEEIPRRVEIVHADPERLYEPGTQSAQRTRNPVSTQESNDSVTIEVPAAISASQAKQLAETALYSAWMERTQQKIVTMPKYMALSPGDVVTLDLHDRDPLTVRIVKEDVGPGQTIGLSTVGHDLDTFNSDVVGVGNPGDIFSEHPMAAAELTEVWPADMPALNDSQDTSATSGQASGGPIALYLCPTVEADVSEWPGAQLLRGSDKQMTITQTGLTASPWGIIRTTLVPLAREDILAPLLGPDETDVEDLQFSMNVHMIYGVDSVASCTTDQFFNGYNRAIIGGPGSWELISFRDVTVEDDGSLTLSHILRGQRGTDYRAEQGHDHAIFILLQSDAALTENYTIDLDLGQFLVFAANTIGSLENSGLSRRIVVMGEIYRPYAGVQFTATENAGDIDLAWVRRTRTGGDDDLRDYVEDVPLAEEDERYIIDVYLQGTDVTVAANKLRHVTGLVTPAWTYTDAMMTTDGVALDDRFNFQIYQLSTAVGAGFPLTGLWNGNVESVVAAATMEQDFEETADATVEDDETEAMDSLSFDGSTEYAEG